ncbi:hypothetical protein QFZ94_002089 [Paraburkholderia sp. JPY465]
MAGDICVSALGVQKITQSRSLLIALPHHFRVHAGRARYRGQYVSIWNGGDVQPHQLRIKLPGDAQRDLEALPRGLTIVQMDQ